MCQGGYLLWSTATWSHIGMPRRLPTVVFLPLPVLVGTQQTLGCRRIPDQENITCSCVKSVFSKCSEFSWLLQQLPALDLVSGRHQKCIMSSMTLGAIHHCQRKPTDCQQTCLLCVCVLSASWHLASISTPTLSHSSHSRGVRDLSFRT